MSSASPYTCGQCGRGFTCVSAFDQHQRMTGDERGTVTCLHPAEVGLHWRDTRTTGWGWPPPTPEQRQKLQRSRSR